MWVSNAQDLELWKSSKLVSDQATNCTN